MFEQTYELLPNSWLYLGVPTGGPNAVLIVETITPGPLMLPLIRVRTTLTALAVNNINVMVPRTADSRPRSTTTDGTNARSCAA